MYDQHDVSRRRFIKSATGAAAAPAAILAAGKHSATAAASVHAVATVVRATHSRSYPQALRIGVRVSVRAPEVSLENLVLLVEPVSFSSGADKTGAAIAASVRSQVAARLEERGMTIREDDIAVRVFGGVL
jgi:hypothetical protein